MKHSLSRSVVSRLLAVATVLTLVGFAASVDLQPESARAAPGVSADLSAGMVSLADDDNRNGDENRNENRNNHDGNGNDNRNNDEHRNNNDDNNNDENRNHDDNENHENNENTGGQGIFSTICSVPGFANNVGCASGLLGG